MRKMQALTGMNRKYMAWKYETTQCSISLMSVIFSWCDKGQLTFNELLRIGSM